MNSPNDRPSLPGLLRKLFKNLSLDWISVLLDIGTYLRGFLCAQPTGPYEILDYESTLELLDISGKIASFRKRLQVKFLQNGVIAFEDYAWGDGEILADYKCVPGEVVDKYREGDRWNILVSLRESKSIGDTEEFYIERIEKNAFTMAEEWLQTEIRRRTRRLRINIVFPKERRCLRAVLTQRRSNRAHVLGSEHIRILPDGRQIVTWETKDMNAYDVITLKWQW